MKKDGFTLVELLAIIVILAIILAIAIPSVTTVIRNSTVGSFENDAKMVLTAIGYKVIADGTFDPSTVNETNINSLLDLSNANYQSLTVKKMNNTLYITIVGKNKWANLTASGTKKIIRVDDTVTALSYGANKPVLATNMVPIKWVPGAMVDEVWVPGTWVDTTTTDTAWYNYDTTNRQWANARTADGSMWVWIPRYIYKISSGWHLAEATGGTIDIQFTKGVDDNWNKGDIDIGSIDLGETANASNNKWTNHPAFTFGDTELTGIWVAKFEASAVEALSNGYTANSLCNNENDNVTTKTVKILPNAQSWRCISVGNTFAVSRNMETNSVYGWGATGNGIDTHLIKNIEWGAVAYLSKSIYGKDTEEIWINPANNNTTGCAGDSESSDPTTGCLNAYDTTNGVKASTTGTIYGVYDMAGGAWERVAALTNFVTGDSTNQGDIVINASAKYKDIYDVGTDDVATYNLAINKKGDAIYETSSTGDSYVGNAWYGDCSYMSSRWYYRGGHFTWDEWAGAFTFVAPVSAANSHIGFRPILLVGKGL